MIEIRTGLPGACKTLSIVAELAAMLARWGKHPQEGRPIFTNIKGLVLPHSPIPIAKVIESKEGTKTYVPDWDLMPDGSFVVFDEAQDFFPPRSSQSTAPPHVAWLNTHRHHGFDICFITQHPKLIDGAIRALCGKHKHYRRLFGFSESVCYEWDGCSDSLAGMKNAVTSRFSHPKKAFEWYKSAEVHTKQKFKLPLWLAIPVIGFALVLVFVPRAYSVISNGIHGKPLMGEKSQASSGKVVSASPVAPSGAASVPSAAGGAPASSSRVIASAPVYVGCISNANRCSCVTAAGVVDEEPEMCRESSRRGGLLVPISMVPSQSRPVGQNIAPSDRATSSEARDVSPGRK